MTNSKQLYQEVILDHNRKPRNWGALADATHKAEGVNPLCGDHIHLNLKLNGDTVEALMAHEGFAKMIRYIAKQDGRVKMTLNVNQRRRGRNG